MPEVASEGTIEQATDRTPIRVLVADDEAAVVDVLRALVGSDPSLRFVGSANDAEAAIDLALRESGRSSCYSTSGCPVVEAFVPRERSHSDVLLRDCCLVRA